MSVPSLDGAARRALACFPPILREGQLHALGNHQGFSGARLWRLEGPAGALCLRGWPPGDPGPERLRFIHRLMALARTAGLAVVPAVFPAESGATWAEEAGRLWELTAWMPGRADFHDRPTPPRLQAACIELARLHRAWEGVSAPADTCPAIERRLQRVREWQERCACGWRPAFTDDPVRPWAEGAWRLLRVWHGRVPSVLAPWAGRPLPLQPCLCDIWHDHVLYEGDLVTGLIDFGGVKVDHVSVDLARLLGSLVGDASAAWTVGMEAYRQVRPLAPEEEALARVLDQTGVIVGAMTWLRWLYVEGKAIEDQEAAARRLAALVRRMERWP